MAEGTRLPNHGTGALLPARSNFLLVAGSQRDVRLVLRRQHEAHSIILADSRDYDVMRILAVDSVDGDRLKQTMVLQVDHSAIVFQIDPSADFLTADIGAPNRQQYARHDFHHAIFVDFEVMPIAIDPVLK